MTNRSRDILLKLGLASESTIEPCYPRVRDREDVGVLRDRESGVVFLNRTDHIDLGHYEAMKGGSYWGGADRAEALKKYREDDERRAGQFKDLVAGKDVVDIGCGTGGFMDLIKPTARSVSGAEPQEYIRQELARLGYPMVKLAADLPVQSFDVAALFHTLEHVAEPIALLNDVRRALRPGGLVLVEVPHARDALLSLDAFKRFSFWSEHIILHTKESLTKFLEAAGFTDVTVEGYQRYPLANHLGWIIDGAPGGQNKYADLADSSIAAAYAKHLADADKTDTLIATAHI